MRWDEVKDVRQSIKYRGIKMMRKSVFIAGLIAFVMMFDGLLSLSWSAEEVGQEEVRSGLDVPGWYQMRLKCVKFSKEAREEKVYPGPNYEWVQVFVYNEDGETLFASTRGKLLKENDRVDWNLKTKKEQKKNKNETYWRPKKNSFYRIKVCLWDWAGGQWQRVLFEKELSAEDEFLVSGVIEKRQPDPSSINDSEMFYASVEFTTKGPIKIETLDK